MRSAWNHSNSDLQEHDMTTGRRNKISFVVPRILRGVLGQGPLILLGSLLLGLVVGVIQPDFSLMTFGGVFMALLCVAAGGAYVKYSQRWESLQRHLAQRN